ncbi:MAG: biotin/lipoyl-binding protein, partial [Planctomycetota bacterium]|nr:biotin/lipoyl-binding protein [Planctomycetota bacterium]
MRHIRVIISILVSSILIVALVLWNVLLADNQGTGIVNDGPTATSTQADLSGDNLPTSQYARPVKTMVISGNSQGACKTTYPGTLKPSMAAKMAFRVGGPLVEVKIKPGDAVRKGDVLMRIDPRDYENQVAATNAALEASHAELAAMEKGAREEDIRALEAGLEAANAQKKYAQQQHKRFSQLVETNVVTQAQFDAVISELNVAASKVRSVEAELAKAKAGARAEDILSKKSGISGLDTQLIIAKDKLDDTCLRAPFDGIITCQNVEIHEQVSPQQIVLGMQNVSTLEVQVNLPEKEILYRGFDVPFTADVHFEAALGRTFKAAYKEINTEADKA